MKKLFLIFVAAVVLSSCAFAEDVKKYREEYDIGGDKIDENIYYPSINKMKGDYDEWSVSDKIKDDVWKQKI